MPRRLSVPLDKPLWQIQTPLVLGSVLSPCAAVAHINAYVPHSDPSAQLSTPHARSRNVLPKRSYVQDKAPLNPAAVRPHLRLYSLMQCLVPGTSIHRLTAAAAATALAANRVVHTLDASVRHAPAAHPGHLRRGMEVVQALADLSVPRYLR